MARKAKNLTAAAEASEFVIKHGKFLIGPDDQRTKGETVTAEELGPAIIAEALEDGRIEPVPAKKEKEDAE
jgi:hypothetical protein